MNSSTDCGQASMDGKKDKTILLKGNSLLNQQMIDHLEELLCKSSAKTLQASLQYIFFHYLYHAKLEDHPVDFPCISEDFYFLYKFLEACREG